MMIHHPEHYYSLKVDDQPDAGGTFSVTINGQIIGYAKTRAEAMIEARRILRWAQRTLVDIQRGQPLEDR